MDTVKVLNVSLGYKKKYGSRKKQKSIKHVHKIIRNMIKVDKKVFSKSLTVSKEEIKINLNKMMMLLKEKEKAKYKSTKYENLRKEVSTLKLSGTETLSDSSSSSSSDSSSEESEASS